MIWQLVALGLGVAAGVIPWRRIPPAVAVSLVAVIAVAVGIVPTGAAGDAVRALDEPLAFLLVAVPLAVTLDRSGFFRSAAALVDGGRHLRVGLWLLAAFVTVCFNLDAAVVLLTPLYVHIGRHRGEDVLALAFIPALMASLASSVLPVSNLTNLIVADHLDLGAGDFLRHAAPAAVAATAVGWFGYRRVFASPAAARVVDEPVDRRALAVGGTVVAVLLIGFTLGDRVGVPAWLVAGVALALAAWLTGSLAWRSVPVLPALLALALGTLALGAADGLDLGRLVTRPGTAGETLTFGLGALGSNVVNNLPMTLVLLDPLRAAPDRVWPALLGVNLGPLLWATGALSTLLWQSTMAELGVAVTARRYAAVGVRVGVPAMLVALAVRLLIG